VIAAAHITPEIGEKAISRANWISSPWQGAGADPDLPNKLARGREKDIRPCIHCNHCIETLPWAEGVACVVNPALGMERNSRLRKRPSPRR